MTKKIVTEKISFNFTVLNVHFREINFPVSYKCNVLLNELAKSHYSDHLNHVGQKMVENWSFLDEKWIIFETKEKLNKNIWFKMSVD